MNSEFSGGSTLDFIALDKKGVRLTFKNLEKFLLVYFSKL